MTRFIGGVLIIYAAFMAGHAVGRTHVKRVGEIEELLFFLKMFKAQIAYAGTELPELISDCERRLTGSVAWWLNCVGSLLSEKPDETFALIWHESMKVLAEQGCLPREAILEADRLGKIMGYMDVAAQLSQIALIERSLDEIYKRESGRTERVLRLSSSLGILGGLFLVIMLI